MSLRVSLRARFYVVVQLLLCAPCFADGSLQSCISKYSGVHEGLPSLNAGSALEQTRSKAWEIFQDEVRSRLMGLSEPVRAKVQEKMREVIWKDLGNDAGTVKTTDWNALEVDYVHFSNHLKGKVTSIPMLRHELEHIIDFVERGQNVSRTLMIDRLHPRTLTSRLEGRAFRAQYGISRKIISQVDPASLRALIAEESGLKGDQKEYLETALKHLMFDKQGRLIYPEGVRDPDQFPYFFAEEVLAAERAVTFGGDMEAAKSQSMQQYLKASLSRNYYQKLISVQSKAKRPLLVAYGVLAASATGGAFQFFSGLFEKDLQEAGIKKPGDRSEVLPGRP